MTLYVFTTSREKLKKEYEDLKAKLIDLPLKLKHDFKVDELLYCFVI